MSRIDELIAEHCPNGVEFQALGDVAPYSKKKIESSKLNETNFVGVDNLLPNKAGKTTASYPPNTSKLTMYQPGDILIGNIRPYLKKIWIADNQGGCSGDVLCLSPLAQYRESLLDKFLYYTLSSDGFFSYNMRYAKGAKMPRGSKADILKYKIPIPPMAVQREIVVILDKFTKLEAELEAELKFRRQQYEHYRNQLLTFDPAGGVRWVPMGKIATVGTGHRDTKDAIIDGAYSFYARGKEILSLPEYDFDEKAIITAGDGAGVGKVFHYVDGKYALHQRAYRIHPHSEVTPRFLYHYILSSFGKYISKISVHASVTSLRRPMFINFPVPVPKLDDQIGIVSILDKFDALVNDLSIGLPAELAARRKQYEYYRDKLLTFHELGT